MRKFVWLVIVIVFTLAVLEASPGFQVFLGGTPVTLHPAVLHDQIYLPLSETAALFHLKADVDLPGKRIVLEPESSTSVSPPQPLVSAQTNVILGKIEDDVNPSVEKPMLNVKLTLFKPNGRYDEDVNLHAVKLWILRNDSFYPDTHGKIVDTVSDSDGHFAFSKIPPGFYELVAVRPLSSRETGFWWLPVHLVKGEVKEITLRTDDLTRLPLIPQR